MRLKSAAFLLAAGLLAAPHVPARAQTAAPATNSPKSGETPAQRDARMGWWRAARFGMFIHWGLYAVPAGTWDGRQTSGLGEWIMHDDKIPVKDYAASAARFNPVKFDADQWVCLAKAAGMKYIVITAKHHEGFAMFPTRVDDYSLAGATPFHRDPVKELAAACKKQGIKLGFYYSQAQDWHHPGGAAAGGHWDPAQEGSMDDYLQTIVVPQVRELLSHYGPVSVLWWDTPVGMTPERAAKVRAVLSLQPGLITNNRLGGGDPGDTETPEQRIPATGIPGRDWETCMTINDTWGYKSFDTNFKSSGTLLHNLIDIASKGGNYLLNVGPTAQGVIPAPEVQRLRAIGAWMDANGQSIYGTTASPFKTLPFDGRCTRKGDTLYLQVFHWPESGLTLPGLKTPVRDARVLAGGQRLTVQTAGDGTVTLSRPAKLDPVATVVALRLTGPPVVSQVTPRLTPQTDGRFVLSAADADIQGGTAQLETRGETPNIGYWTDAQDTVGWALTVPTAGQYQVALEYACPTDTAGSTYAVGGDGTPSLTGTVAGTGGWDTFQTTTLPGTLALPAGPVTLRITPKTMPQGAVMNLRRLVLIPVASQ